MLRLALAAIALVAAAPAAAQTGWWRSDAAEIDRDDTSCTLHVPFSAADRTRVSIRLGLDGTRIATVSGRRWRFEEGKRYRLRFFIGKGRTKRTLIEADGTGFRTADGWRGVHMTMTEDQLSQFLMNLQHVEDITRGRPRPLGDVTGPRWRSSVDRCVAELAARDPGSGLPAVAEPVLLGRFESLMNLDDYPANAIRAEQQGRVQMRLTISAKGRISNCQITRSSGSYILDETSCTLLRRRARFSPARDAAGDATEGVYEQGIDWSLPPNWIG